MSRITQGLLASEKELKMAKGSWEGSAKDTAQDKKLAKKHGMSMSAWEKSSMDTKHDKQQSTKGLRGGGIAVKGKGVALKHGGKVGKYAMGGVAQAVMPGGSVMPGTGGPDPMVRGPGMQGSIGSAPAVRGGGGVGIIPIDSGRLPGKGGNLRRVRDWNPRGPGGGMPPGGGPLPMKKGGAVKEADSGEMYASKAAMKKHEAKESPAMEKAEHKRGGGIATRGMGVALKKGGAVKKRGGGIAQRGMGIALKGGGRAKGCM